MLEEEKHDRFSNLMFGARKREGAHKVNSQKEEYDWILGKRKPTPNQEHNEVETNNPLEKILQNIDFEETIKHFDTLMTSANELKPLLKNVRPLIDIWFSKK